jgi:hypothetical protein
MRAPKPCLDCGLKASAHVDCIKDFLQIFENYELRIQGGRLPHMRDGKYANRTYLGEVRLKLQAAYFLVALDPHSLSHGLLTLYKNHGLYFPSSFSILSFLIYSSFQFSTIYSSLLKNVNTLSLARNKANIHTTTISCEYELFYVKRKLVYWTLF